MIILSGTQTKTSSNTSTEKTASTSQKQKAEKSTSPASPKKSSEKNNHAPGTPTKRNRRHQQKIQTHRKTKTRNNQTRRPSLPRSKNLTRRGHWNSNSRKFWRTQHPNDHQLLPLRRRSRNERYCRPRETHRNL